MAGGQWELQNKKQPGVYINFKSSPQALSTVGERGIVAIGKELNWGPMGEIIDVISIADVYNKLGYDITDSRMKFAQQMFRGSSRGLGAASLLVYRFPTTGGSTATGSNGGITISALYEGSRGNDITSIFVPDIDSEVPTPDTGSLVATVTDTDSSAPATGITINLLLNGSFIKSFITDGSGQATFTGLEIGAYAITASTGNILMAPININVQSGAGEQHYVMNVNYSATGTPTAPSDPTQPTPIPPETVYSVYTVQSVIDGIIKASQKVGSKDNPAKLSMLVPDGWVTFSGDPETLLTPTAGVKLFGGVDGVISPTAYASFLLALEPRSFTVLCYDGTDPVTKTAVVTFCQRLGYQNGRYAHVVLADYPGADEIMVSSVKNGMDLNDGTTLTKEQLTWWIAGIEASAGIAQSMTYAIHPDGVRANPTLTSPELDASIDEGSLAVIEEFNQVKVMTDINTFTTYQPEKGKIFSKNRTVRVLFSLANDIYRTFAQYYIGQVDNTPAGRNLFKAEIANYCLQLQGVGAIQNFNIDDVEVLPGLESDSIVVNVLLQVVGSIEKIYMTVTVTAEEIAA